jgi:hypothetical protein
MSVSANTILLNVMSRVAKKSMVNDMSMSMLRWHKGSKVAKKNQAGEILESSKRNHE